MEMKRIYQIIGLCIGMGLFSSCRQEERSLYEGEGLLLLGMEVSEQVDVVSRAASAAEDNQDELKAKCKVRIYEGDKLVRKYAGWNNVPAEGITLASRPYRVRITSGDSVAASFDRKFYEGNQEFEIRKGATTKVDVVCYIANALVQVNFDKSLTDYLTEGKVEVSVEDAEGTLAFPYPEAEGGQPTGYYTFPAGKEYLTCKFTATTKSGEKIEQTDRIEGAKTSTLYKLTYRHTDGETPERPEEGGGFFDLVIDETPLHTQDEEVVIYQRPVISMQHNGETVSTDAPWLIEVNEQNVRPQVTVKASSPLQQVNVGGTLFGFLGGSTVDLMQEDVRQQFAAQGIAVSLPQERQMTIDFQEYLYSAGLLAAEGNYEMAFDVRDQQGKQRASTWALSISNSNVQTLPIPYPYLIWADRATLYGEIIEGRQAEGPFYFRYRKKGSDENWSENVEGSQQPDSRLILSPEIKGLTPGTTYEYQLLESEKPSSIVCEFTTEAAVQLPNYSFENWSGGVPKLIHGSGESMFWDSGNHGTQKVSANVTEPDSSVKHSGNYSARLKSMYASMLGIGQFAAGNMFIGQYLDTQMSGLTGNGVLGLGRPFTARPLALRGYIRYISGTVDKGGDRIANGKQDEGIIYMALTDGEGESYNGTNWSFIIRTKDQHFFSKDEANVIAYGEKVWTANTEGEGMVPFEIRFNYEEKADGKTRIPNRLLLVAAASRYGDYFQGSTQSVMWLDDLELVYEERELSSN